MRTTLVQHRDRPNVWERAEGMSEWDAERWLVVLAANVCVFAGFRRRSFTGLLLIIAGRMLAWWATLGAVPRPIP